MTDPFSFSDPQKHIRMTEQEVQDRISSLFA